MAHARRVGIVRQEAGAGNRVRSGAATSGADINPTLLAAAAAIAVSVWVPYDAFARDKRVPQEFQQRHPCPSTGKYTGGCPGWERDHIIPLCRGGADHPSNMQWLTIEQHRAKTRGDVRSCRRQ